MDVARQVEAFEARVRALGTAERARGEKAYLKSSLDFFGVPVPVIRREATRFRREQSDVKREPLIALCEALWARPVHELRSLAIALLAEYADVLRAKEMGLVERWLGECETWAHVDWLAPHVAGPLVERYASAKRRLSRWAKSDNFWIRRAALLAQLVALREGRGDFDLFADLAAGMLHEKEFFIRKAIGWVLRDVSRRRPELTRRFLKEHLEQLSGLTLREGSRHLPEAVRRALGAARSADAKGG